MRRRLLRSEYGQTAATYALILGGIALVVIVGVLAFGDTLGGLVDSNGQQLRDAGTPSQPAGPAEPIDFPTTLAECLDPDGTPSRSSRASRSARSTSRASRRAFAGRQAGRRPSPEPLERRASATPSCRHARPRVRRSSDSWRGHRMTGRRTSAARRWASGWRGSSTARSSSSRSWWRRRGRTRTTLHAWRRWSASRPSSSGWHTSMHTASRRASPTIRISQGHVCSASPSVRRRSWRPPPAVRRPVAGCLRLALDQSRGVAGNRPRSGRSRAAGHHLCARRGPGSDRDTGRDLREPLPGTRAGWPEATRDPLATAPDT